MKSIAAVVVGYDPDIPVLDNLLISLSSQVCLLILVDNGGSENFLMGRPDVKASVRYLSLQGNKGLGAALNAGFEIAVSEGIPYMVTFDQDSHAAPNLIENLDSAMKCAKSRDERCIAVSPAFYDHRDGKKIAFPFYQSVDGVIKPVFTSDDPDGLVDADALITSGMFVDTQAWKEGAKYNEGMFVDFTDTEWCFRVRDRGYRLYGCLNIEMGHALSDAPPVKIFGLSFFRYSPIRRYFFFRNTVAVCRMPHIPNCWKRRLSTALLLRFAVNLLIDKHRFQSFKMMVRGIRHGFRNQLGSAH